MSRRGEIYARAMVLCTVLASLHCMEALDDDLQARAAKGGQGTTRVVTTSDWATGYCRNVTVSNDSQDAIRWNVSTEIEGSPYNVWNAEWAQQGNTLVARGVSWNAQLAPGQSTDWGFCANRDGGGSSGGGEGGENSSDDGNSGDDNGGDTPVDCRAYNRDGLTCDQVPGLSGASQVCAWGEKWVCTQGCADWVSRCDADPVQPPPPDPGPTNPGGGSRGGDSVVGANGRLQVIDNQLCNEAGQPIQLRGMSSHGLHWYGQFMNHDAIEWLRDDWGMTVVRAAMYTDEGGYLSNPAVASRVNEVVDIAVDLGIYVIIDWHILYDNNPMTHVSQAVSFFQTMARNHGNNPNVLYEICNEPNGAISWAGDVKPYAERVVSAIRAIDPDNIIIIGSPTWSQDIHLAADDPVAGRNLMYSLHFYAGTHGSYLRDRIDYAMNRGIAIFVTEWGTSTASGGGGVFPNETATWLNFLEARNISWANWSLSDKNESSAALNPGASTTGGWSTSGLSPSGQIVRNAMR